MIGVIGAGAWGTALAQVYALAGHDVLLWAREDDVVHSVNEKHENTHFLKGVSLSEKIRATHDLSHMAEKEVILLVTPAQHVRQALAVISRWPLDDRPVVICAKGIELKTGLLMSEVAADVAPGANIAVLTGPTFAPEIARGLPSAVTVAAGDMAKAEKICTTLASKSLRPYASDDLTGAQVAGAAKNVVAIASGILMGRKMGESARAALMARGLAEMARLAVTLGGKRETLLGLCGAGDLMLTASSMQSRNFSLGFHIGEGRSVTDVLGERNAVTEGVHTALAMMHLAAKYGVDMPLARAVYQCLHEDLGIGEAIAALLERPLKAETA
jgi:glycerol-3-phosphate dehydrogenase (NAD(P)+)